MNHRSHFFSKSPAAQTPAVYSIHIGGEQFQAAAVALSDHLKYGTIAVNSLKKILDGFFTHFPQYKPTQAYLTPGQRMDMLLHNPRKSEVVSCLAYTLRQLAVNELLARPLNYIDVFAELPDNLSINQLREPATQLSPLALNALAQVLDIAICLSFKERNKSLRSREVFNQAGEAQLTLLLQSGLYYPQVRNKADFAYVGQLAINPPKPIISQNEETIAAIKQAIALYTKELTYDYEHMYKSLFSMNTAGELPKSKLLDLYITFLPTGPDALRLQQRIAACDAAVNKHSLVDVVENGEQELVKSLTSALAGWLCTGQVSEEQFFERMEARPGARVISVA